MNFFDEITKVKVDFPKNSTISKEVDNLELNFYQLFALCLFIIIIFLGIILGNLFATCETTSFFYSESCVVTQFNFSLMIFIWFVGLMISIILYSVGHIISLLSSINEKLGKNKR